MHLIYCIVLEVSNSTGGQLTNDAGLGFLRTWNSILRPIKKKKKKNMFCFNGTHTYPNSSDISTVAV